MADTTVSSSMPTRKPRRGLRIILWIIGVFLLLVIVLYFVGTSAPFLKGVILPRVSQSLNADITVTDASISPFKEVVLKNLKVQPRGSQEALVVAPELRARYSLMDIIRGNIHVDEVTLTSPTVSVIENPDGTHNYDALLKSGKEKPQETKPAAPAKPSNPAQLDLKKIALTDATVRQVKLYKNGNRDVTELSHIDVTAEDFKNGQTGKLMVKSDIKLQSNPPAPGTNASLQAKFSGNFAIGLTSDLKPASIQGKARLDTTQAAGGMAEITGLSADLDCDVTPKDIKQVALRFQKGGAQLGQVLVGGPFDLEKREGKVDVRVTGIDKQLLNLVGVKSGIDFGTTTINTTNHIELAKAGTQFSLNGQLNVDKLQITRAGESIPAVDLLARYDISPDQIRQVSLQFEKAGSPVGEVKLSGPFSMEKKEGQLALQISSIDKQVLNLAGAKSGIDFGTTTVNASNEITIARSGSLVSVIGQFKVDKFQAIRNGQATPSLDLLATFDETADLTAKTNLLKTLTLVGQQGGNPLLKAELTAPMSLAWGDVTNAVGDSALTFSVTHLNLADWKPFVGDVAPAGDANLKLALLAQQAGKKISFDLDSHIDNLTAGSGTNLIRQAALVLQARGQALDLKHFELENYKMQLAQQNQPMLSFTGSGKYDTDSQNADVQVTGQMMLARLLQALNQPDVNISSGTVELKAHVVQTPQVAAANARSSSTNRPPVNQNVSGNLTVTDLTGTFGKNQFQAFGSTMDLDVVRTPEQIQIRKLSGKVTQGPNAGGSFDVSATVLTNKSAQFSAKLTDFNQDGLRPFLEPMLADKKLVSIGIKGSASGNYDPNGDSAVKADFQMANLVVNDPQHQFPATPLEAKMQVDASIRNQIANVKQFLIGLTPTQRGKNEVQLTGQVDMSKTNAAGKQYEGKLQLTADSLDLTSYYDLFAGGTNQQTKTAAAPANSRPSARTNPSTTTSVTGAAQEEPKGKELPFRNFTAEMKIGRFYLRELEMTNLQATTKIDGGKVSIQPLQVAINGAPVNASVGLDLGVPGYRYDLNLDMKQVPFAPIVNTFQPERRGDVKGTLTAMAKGITATGTSGAALQKTLAGQFEIGTTNLELTISKLRSPLMKMIINVIAIVPELRSGGNLGSTVGSLAGSLFGGQTAQRGGWAGDLQQSPIDIIEARGKIGSGRVDLDRAFVSSPAFQVETHGAIVLAEVLTNSTLNPPQGLPLGISVRRGLAEKINMVPSDTPQNVAFVRLPDYVAVTGTVSDPKEKLNKTALLGTALQQIGANVPGNNQTGGALQALGGLLTGRQPASTNATANQTNAPPPSQSPVNSLLNQFLKPKK